MAYLPALILAAWAIAAAAGARDGGAAVILLLAITVLMQISQSIRRHFGGKR